MKVTSYSLIKEQFPNFNGMERANKMLEYIEDSKIVKESESKLAEYRDIIRNAKALKHKQREQAKPTTSRRKTKKSSCFKKVSKSKQGSKNLY